MNLKELARELGLSKTTISRALNGFPEVGEETRARVEKAARKFGYAPNTSARRLAIGRVGAVGIVLPGHLSDRYGAQTVEYVSGLAEGLASAKIDLLMSPLLDEDEMAIYRRWISSKSVDAVILTDPVRSDPRIKLFVEKKFPFVLHGSTDVDLPYAWLDIDNEDAYRQATSYLLDLGHKEIAIIEGLAGFTFTEDRQRGYVETLAGRGIEPRSEFIVHDRFTTEAGFRAASRLLSMTPRPTAFIVGSMMTTVGVYQAIRSNGWEVGREVSVIAHDDVFPYMSATDMVPMLTTTRSSVRLAGLKIAAMLVSILDGKDAPSLSEKWSVELIVRQSTAPPRT